MATVQTIVAEVETLNHCGTTIEHLCARMQATTDKVLYVEESLAYSVSFDEWVTMWKDSPVILDESGVDVKDDPRMWILYFGEGCATEVWVFRKDAVDAVLPKDAVLP